MANLSSIDCSLVLVWGVETNIAGLLSYTRNFFPSWWEEDSAPSILPPEGESRESRESWESVVAEFLIDKFENPNVRRLELYQRYREKAPNASSEGEDCDEKKESLGVTYILGRELLSGNNPNDPCPEADCGPDGQYSFTVVALNQDPAEEMAAAMELAQMLGVNKPRLYLGITMYG